MFAVWLVCHTAAGAELPITYGSTQAKAIKAHQSTAKYFAVSAGDDESLDGVRVEISEFNNFDGNAGKIGKVVNTRGYPGAHIKGNVEMAKRCVLGACAESSGKGRPIADGMFIIVKGTFVGDVYHAVVQRLEPNKGR